MTKAWGKKCDFCSPAQPALWDYPTRTFDVVFPLGTKPPGFHSIGDWLACDECAEMIERNDIDAICRVAPPGLTRTNHRAVIEKFFANRLGERVGFG
jgi:hypothetical protein